jgi:hypothetical protein
MCIRDSYVYQKGVLCFFIREGYVRSVKPHCFVPKYAAVPVQLKIVILQYTGWRVRIVWTFVFYQVSCFCQFLMDNFGYYYYYYYYYYLFEFNSYNGWGYLLMNVWLYNTWADRAGNRGYIPWEGQRIFVFRNVHNDYPQGQRSRGMNWATAIKFKGYGCVELHLQYPIRPHGVMLIFTLQFHPYNSASC